MFTKKEYTELKRTIKFLGFNESSGKCGARVFMYTTLSIGLIINCSLFVLNKWDNIDNRVTGLKALILSSICFMYLLVYVLNWNECTLTIQTIERGHYRFPYPYTSKRIDLERRIRNDMSNLNTLWYYGPLSYTLLAITLPLIVVAVQFFKNNLVVRNLFLPLPTYYPYNYETLPVYFLSYISQSFFHIFLQKIGYLTVISALTSIQMVEGEFKLLRLSLEEMDQIICNSIKIIEDKIDNVGTSSDISYSENHQMQAMTKFVRYFVKHHQYVYRHVRSVTKGVQSAAIILNCGSSFYLCMAIYILVQREDIISKIQEGGFCLLAIFNVFCYDFMGEKIAFEDENLRRALYQCTWSNKPLWFKKSLLIIMSRTDKKTEIKSIGLFHLNLRNFTRTVNAVYSYYNVLNNLKK